MHLITMAHAGEAQGVIKKFQLSRISHDLYKNNEMVLLLTGEGPFEAATKTALIIPQYKFNDIINLGIAGSLAEDLKIGDFVSIRTLYLIHGQSPAFKSFQCSDIGHDCLTSFERILDPEKTKALKGLGHLVDREAWGVAMAAKSAGIPLKCYKVISDVAGSMDACEVVKEKAFELSLKLASELATILNLAGNKPQTDIHLKGFYFTFSTEHQFKNLLNKLSIKNEMSSVDTLQNLNLEKLRTLEIPPKERTKRLLEEMETAIDPVKAHLHAVRHSLTKTFSDQGLRVQFDPQWENPKLTLSMEIENDKELKDKIEVLKSLSIEPFTMLMQGQFDVE